MDISLLLQMAAEAFPGRVAVGTRADGLSYAGLLDASRRAGALLADRPAERAGLADVSSAALPVLLFGAAVAGRVFAPVNYRLADDRLRALVAQTRPGVLRGRARQMPPASRVSKASRSPHERRFSPGSRSMRRR